MLWVRVPLSQPLRGRYRKSLAINLAEGSTILDRDLRSRWSGREAWLFIAILLDLWLITAFVIVRACAYPGGPNLIAASVVAACSLLLSGYALRRLRRREQLRLGPKGLEYVRIDWLRWDRRVIPLPEVRRLTPYRVPVASPEQGPARLEHGLAVETIGRTLRVGQGLDPEDIERLRQDLECQIQERLPAWISAPDCLDCEWLDDSGVLTDPPSDSTVSCRRDWDGAEFSRRLVRRRPAIGPYELILLVFLGVMVQPLFSTRPSLAAAGPTAAALAAIAVAASRARRVWIVRPGEITTGVRLFGLGWSATEDVEWLERMEMRRLASGTPWDAWFELVLVDLDGHDKAVVGPLTEGEARWMAGIVAPILRDSLPRSGQQIHRWSVRTHATDAAGSPAMADPWLDGAVDRPKPGIPDEVTGR
ncbi:MAG: hypothetical protein ACYC61_16945 [Isosphaeraceae bacterium]